MWEVWVKHLKNYQIRKIMKKFKHKTTEWRAETHPIIPNSYRLKHDDELIAVPAELIENSSDWKDYEILEYVSVYASPIKRVRRLSDGEVFSVGDDVEAKKWLGVRGKILRIEEKNGSLRIHFWKSFSFLDEIQKSRKPILTSEDGVELFEGDKGYVYDKVTGKSYHIRVSARTYCPDDYTYYSSREAAEEYRLNNARVLSMNDVMNFFGAELPFDGSIDVLEKIVKSRL